MSISFKWDGGKLNVDLLEGERLLCSETRINLVSGLALPSYRISGPMWKVIQMMVAATDRRVVVVATIWGIGTQTLSLWYPGAEPAGEPELLTQVRADKNWCGEYLETRSRNDHRPWYHFCSARLRLRFYIGTSRTMTEQILAAMARVSH